MNKLIIYFTFFLIKVSFIANSSAQISMPAETGKWFPLESRAPLSPGAISMDGWLDAPAEIKKKIIARGDSFLVLQ